MDTRMICTPWIVNAVCYNAVDVNPIPIEIQVALFVLFKLGPSHFLFSFFFAMQPYLAVPLETSGCVPEGSGEQHAWFTNRTAHQLLRYCSYEYVR